MNDARTGEVEPRKSLHSLPRPAAVTSLAATTKLKQPVASYLVHETVDAVTVARDGMIIQPALYNTPQPTTRFAHRSMSSLAQFCFDLPQLGTYAFGHRMAMNREPALLASLGTLVREAKEIESFRPALAASFTSFHRIATKLDQTRFSFVQFQSKLGEPRAEFLQTRRRLAVVFKTDHEVIRKSYRQQVSLYCPSHRLGR